ncbi:adenylate kinase [compost metagenome]
MLVFIAGVHGVGKGYLCTHATNELNFLHKSASELIREFGDVQLDKNKLTENINKNQLILLTALAQLKKGGSNILLDGHFTLLAKDGSITPLDTEVFNEMLLDGIILVTEPENIIKKRIHSRDGIDINYDLNNLLKSETEHARKVSSYLGIELIELNSPSEEEFIDALKKLSTR